MASGVVNFLSELIRIGSVCPPGDYDAIARRVRAGFHGSGMHP